MMAGIRFANSLKNELCLPFVIITTKLSDNLYVNDLRIHNFGTVLFQHLCSSYTHISHYRARHLRYTSHSPVYDRPKEEKGRVRESGRVTQLCLGKTIYWIWVFDINQKPESWLNRLQSSFISHMEPMCTTF